MNAVARLGEVIARIFRRTMPDPFVLALLLTAMTALLALTLGFPRIDGQSWVSARASAATRLLDAWRGDEGLWKLLGFAMQMCLVLVTGHALAATPAVRRLLASLAERPKTPGGAAALVGFVACVAGLLNWGLGLIVGAVLAREVGQSMLRRGRPVHYPLLCAAGYTCMMVWHGGLSGSAPLLVSTRAAALKTMSAEQAARLVGDGIPLSETIFSPLNILITSGLLLLVPLTLWLLAPTPEASTPPPRIDDAATPAPSHDVAEPLGAERLDHSRLLAWGLAAALAAALARSIAVNGPGAIGLNEVNLAMMLLGLLLHGSPMNWIRAVEDGAVGCAGIIVQFPLYAGIIGMLAVSGLVGIFARGMTDLGDAGSVPLLTVFVSSVVNIFVPSGGGQWAIQGPIALEAGQAVGAAPGVMVLSVAYGDQLTNMLQPFWALPLLAITRVKASEIVGYDAIVMMVGGIWVFGVMGVWL